MYLLVLVQFQSGFILRKMIKKSLTVVANSTETKNPECKSPGFFSFLELRLH